MRRRTLTLMTAVWACNAAAAGGGPAVVHTAPPSGAIDVDPARQEIRVVFDREMAARYSFVIEAGGRFPEVAGTVSWPDRRTCVLPVRLEPGRQYAVGINTGGKSGFRSSDGTPAQPLLLRFRTTGGVEVDSEKNAGAIRRLRRAIDDHYSYRDRIVADWDELLERHRSMLIGARTPFEFAEGLSAILAAADDIHISVRADGVQLWAKTEAPARNFDLSGIRRAVPGLKQLSGPVHSARFGDDIGYLLVGTWQRERAAELQALHVALDELLDTRGLIVDFRANGGGSEAIARRFAARFLERPAAYAGSVTRDPDQPDGWSEVRRRELQPVEDEEARYRGLVVVLQGRFTVSSAEAGVLMFRQVPGCVTVGDRTRGASGNPRPHALGNGVVVELPSWRALDAGGRAWEGTGIAPDVPVTPRPELFADGDPVIEKALEIIRKKLSEEGL